MSALIRAELLKLRTTRMIYGFVAATLGLVALNVAATILTAGVERGGPSLDTTEGVRHVLSAASAGSEAVLLLGILMMAGEFRHGTATPTFLVTPNRGRVVLAKLAASLVTGVVVTLIDAVFTVAIALPWLALKHASVGGSTLVAVLAGAVVAGALSGAVGVGLGALIRNQVLAITVALVWVLVVEALVSALLPSVGRWLPGGAVDALTTTSVNGHPLLPVWAAVALLLGYAGLFAAAGSRLVLRRDVV